MTRIEGDKNRHLWNSVCIKQSLSSRELNFGVVYLGLPGSYQVSVYSLL